MRTIRSILNCVSVLIMIAVSCSISINKSFARSQIPTIPEKTFTVVIDAGHGGKDPGAMGKISREKDIALAIALKTGSYISSLINDVNVIYTRTTDVYVDLYKRADIAIENKADLFMSIHVNGNNNSSIYGAETYVMGPSKSEKNFEIAKKENSVINLEEDKTQYEGFDPQDEASYIMFSVMQNTFLNQSLLMASQVQDQLRIRGKRKDGGVRQGPFLVLWRTSMPSVLIETGYISNREEEKYLNTENGQDIIASAIYRAFKNYKEEIQKRTENALQSDNESSNEEIGLMEEVKNLESQDENLKSATSGLKENTDIQATLENNTEKAEKIISETEQKAQEKGIIYRVQLLASKTKIEAGSHHFKGVTGIKEFYIDGYYKYMSQAVSNYSQSRELRKKLIEKFPGAFIVAWLDGKKIPLAEAQKMEQEK